MYTFKFINTGKLPIYQQIAQAIIRDIEKGLLEKDTILPSINEFHAQQSVGRDTIEKAYRLLKAQGYISAVAGKGYYVKGKKDSRLKILLVFNKLSPFKKIIYDSFLETLGPKAKVDLKIHHYDPKILKEIIQNSLGHYHYYVIMPHFFHNSKKKEYVDIIKSIPQNDLVILDKNLPELKGHYIAVYQDFKQDIYNAFHSAADLLAKYDRLTIVLPGDSHHPLEIIDGATKFWIERRKKIHIIDKADNEILNPGTVYLVIDDADLATLIKKVRASPYKLGKETGIISFNETVLKEVLDITVITTDFDGMGRTVARLILKGEYRQIKNPFKMIIRASL